MPERPTRAAAVGAQEPKNHNNNERPTSAAAAVGAPRYSLPIAYYYGLAVSERGALDRGGGGKAARQVVAEV
jgi:hypothetical protein